VERIAQLEESNQDWQDEVDALTEEIDEIQDRWKRAIALNEELTERVKSLVALNTRPK
jgi:peptidoglycan hydrolase CwlO-like protein